MISFLIAFFGFWFTPEPPFFSTDLNNGLEKAMVEDIQHSQKSIRISIFSLSDPAIIRALKERAKAGVAITVVVDGDAAKGAASRLGPTITTHSLKDKGLMHHKLIVIDDRVAWIGSANLTQESLKSHSNLMQRFESPALASYLVKKIDALAQPGLKKRIPHETFTVNDQTLQVWFLPDNPDATLKIKELIRSARKTVKVAMYTFTRADFVHELARAAKRGVKVEVIIDRSQCDGVCRKVEQQLKEGSLLVHSHDGRNLMHHKFMIIDDTTLVQGSANWTKAAFSKNEDLFIVLSPLTPSQQESLEEIWQALLHKARPKTD
jgi:phosphatidylserine/phosphatidylglycerophosphate/cardiolipin synthase-like enzyme